jgi:hypothetical protein
MTVIGSGTSAEGDRWALLSEGDARDPLTALEVRTPTGHHSKGGYQGPPLSPGMRLAKYTRSDDEGPDQIILRVADDADAAIVTLSDGRRDEVTLFSDPTRPEVRPAALVYPKRGMSPSCRKRFIRTPGCSATSLAPATTCPSST